MTRLAVQDVQPDSALAVGEVPGEDVDEEPLGWLISLLIEENARRT